MVKLNVLELLEKQGRTKYWLYKQLGMSYQNFLKRFIMRQNLSNTIFGKLRGLYKFYFKIHPRFMK